MTESMSLAHDRNQSCPKCGAYLQKVLYLGTNQGINGLTAPSRWLCTNTECNRQFPCYTRAKAQ